MGILFPMGMGMDIVSFGNGMGISTREWEGIDAKKNSSVDICNVLLSC